MKICAVFAKALQQTKENCSNALEVFDLPYSGIVYQRRREVTIICILWPPCFHRPCIILVLSEKNARFSLLEFFQSMKKVITSFRGNNTVRLQVQGWRNRGAKRGGTIPPDVFRWVNPILTRGADYAHHISTCPLRFSDLPPSLKWISLPHRNAVSALESELFSRIKMA